jgi:hypothetical protein
MKRLVIAVVSLFILTGISAPAQASQGVAKKYSSCADLLKKYPNGVAKNKKARNKAVKGGFAKPKVSKSLYKQNSGRLDRDKDGVMCEQEGTSQTESEPTPTPTPNTEASFTILPTGVVLVDVWLAALADTGKIDEKEGQLFWAGITTFTSKPFTYCPAMRTPNLKEAMYSALLGDDRLASSGIDPSRREYLASQFDLLIPIACNKYGISTS